jgi:hypothetical protein
MEKRHESATQGTPARLLVLVLDIHPDILNGVARRKKLQDSLSGNARAANYQLSVTDLGFDSDSVRIHKKTLTYMDRASKRHRGPLDRSL